MMSREDAGMGCGRALLCILCPPLAVIGKGCGTVLIVFLLWLGGWVPGALAALIICNQDAAAERALRRAQGSTPGRN